jgi:hypothetical protein
MQPTTARSFARGKAAETSEGLAQGKTLPARAAREACCRNSRREATDDEARFTRDEAAMADKS